MPAEIVPGEFCASYFGTYMVRSSKSAHFYTVTWSSTGSHCTCPSFKYSPEDDRSCKHTRFVFEHACMWNCQWHEGNPNFSIRPLVHSISQPTIPNSHCPNCNGPLVCVMIAV